MVLRASYSAPDAAAGPVDAGTLTTADVSRDPWDHIRRAAADRRSGSVDVALRAAAGIRELTTRTDLRRAARRLLRAHPVMAPIWRLLAAAWDADDVAHAVDPYATSLQTGTEDAADGIRWLVGRRAVTVVTHSSSSSVVSALERIAPRVSRVLCTTSLPGGEGRALARKLSRAGFETEVVADAAVARACGEADLALVGADAVTEHAVVNKVGTLPLSLAAAEAGIGCYAIATTQKLLPASIWGAITVPAAYEPTPLRLFDAVLTERGPRRAAAIRRAAARVVIPQGLARLAR